MARFFILTCIIPLVFSCSGSIKESLALEGVERIKITHYENFYEQVPVGEVQLNSHKDMLPILFLLQFMRADGVIKDDFKHFDSKRIDVEFYNGKGIVLIRVIGNRVEFKRGYLYKSELYREQKFIELIESY